MAVHLVMPDPLLLLLPLLLPLPALLVAFCPPYLLADTSLRLIPSLRWQVGPGAGVEQDLDSVFLSWSLAKNREAKGSTLLGRQSTLPI